MNKKELKFILQEGEGLKIEFKENFSSDIAKEIVAFANSEGGRVFLGVSDKGEIRGIEATNKLKSQIQDIARNCDPSIEVELENFENILIINVEEGKNKPYKCGEGFFIRLGSNSQKMKRDEIIDFAINERKIKFDEQINSDFVYLKDVDEGKLSNYLSLANISKIVPNEKIFAELDVINKKEILNFNNAGVLFFAKEPQKFIPWSIFTVVLFKDKDGTEVIDRKEIGGSLFEIVGKVMDSVKLYTRVAYKFTGKPQRDNIYEYSFNAIREAVINSVMHKDYFEHGHNNILKFFPDRIQIENVWSKPKSFVLGETVYRRNRIIAELFSRIHFGEKIGSGMGRMRFYCKNENAPFPKISFTDTHFYVVFKPSRTYLKMAGEASEKTIENGLVERLVERLVESQKKILEFIKINPHISKKELAEKIGISETAIDKNIISLKKKGLLKRIGADKGGYWDVKNEE